MRTLWLIALIGCMLSACGDKTATPTPASVAPKAPEISKSAGDYAARMAQQHAGEQPRPSPAAGLDPTADVVGETVQYATIEGRPLQGYVAYPAQAEGALPGVLMFHEWWGLNDNIKSMARQLAAQGYVVLATDFYRGEVATDADRAKTLMQTALGRPQARISNTQQAFDFLRAHYKAGRIGTLGWCFGGTMSFEAAQALGEDSDATVIYYGFVNGNAGELAKIQSPVLGLFGGQDQGIPLATVRAFESGMKAAGKSAKIIVYPDAGHAFANPSGEHYRATEAAEAWQATLKFLSAHLQAAEEVELPAGSPP